MRLSTIAQHRVFSVCPNDPLDRAISLMDEHQIHHLPVMESGRLIGMLSDRDLLMAVGWKLEIERVTAGATRRTVGPKSVQEIMSSPPVYLDPDNDIHTAARMMATGKFHAAPLVHRGALVGIVTSTDILRMYCQNDGFRSYSPRLTDLVTKHMRITVITVDPREPLYSAARVLKEVHIRHLPVTTQGELVGVISDRDIRRVCGVEMIEDEIAETAGRTYFGPTMVMEVMSRDVEAVGEFATMLDALKLMTAQRIGCLPVVRGDKLLGLLTETDMLRLVAQIDEEIN